MAGKTAPIPFSFMSSNSFRTATEDPFQDHFEWPGLPRFLLHDRFGQKAFLLAVTSIYLLFEVAFGARLLDVVGTTSELKVYERIEFWGRVISGLAITLLAWSWFVLPRLRRAKPGIPASLGWLAISLLACWLASYTLQEGILRAITSLSKAEDRRAAMTLVLVTGSVHEEAARIDGFSNAGIDPDSPASRSFLALLPAMALATENIGERLDNEIRALVRHEVMSRTGSLKQVFNDRYLPAELEIRGMWNAYVKQHGPYDEAVARIGQEQRKAWASYMRSVRNRPDRIPRSRWSHVASSVRGRGIPVESGWRPTDRAGFDKAIRDRMLSRAKSEFRAAALARTGMELPPDLKQDEFILRPEIQNVFRARLRMVPDIPVDVEMDAAAFETKVYDRWIGEMTDRIVAGHHAPVAAFEPGGEWHGQGVDAIRVAYVPMIAFLFSLAGALTHTTKCAWLAFGVVVCRRERHDGPAPVLRRTGRWAIVAAAFLLALGPFLFDNPVTRTELFRKLEQATESRFGKPTALAARWIVQAQAHFYPVGSAVRRTILLDIRYDSDPTAAVRRTLGLT